MNMSQQCDATTEKANANLIVWRPQLLLCFKREGRRKQVEKDQVVTTGRLMKKLNGRELEKSQKSRTHPVPMQL